MEKSFTVSSTIALLPYSFYVLGLAFGPLISSPLSESYGRRIVYLSCFPLFSLFTLGSGFANNIETLIICRFFAGIFGSPSLAVGAGTITDIWPRAKIAVPMAVYVTTPFLGPSLG